MAQKDLRLRADIKKKNRLIFFCEMCINFKDRYSGFFYGQFFFSQFFVWDLFPRFLWSFYWYLEKMKNLKIMGLFKFCKIIGRIFIWVIANDSLEYENYRKFIICHLRHRVFTELLILRHIKNAWNANLFNFDVQVKCSTLSCSDSFERKTFFFLKGEDF